MKKLVSLLLIFAFATIFLTGCFSTKSTYTILLMEDNKPYSYTLSNKVFGFEADIINAVAAQQGFEVNLTTDQSSDFTCCSSDFTNGSRDYDYTDAYYQKGIIFVTPDYSDFYNYEQLVNTTIGVMKGTCGEDFASQIAPQYNITIKKYTDINDMYRDVKHYNIAGCFDDELFIKHAINGGEPLKTFDNPEKTTSLTFAVSKGKNQQFIKDFNEGLEKIIKNGTYKNILEKY